MLKSLFKIFILLIGVFTITLYSPVAFCSDAQCEGTGEFVTPEAHPDGHGVISDSVINNILEVTAEIDKKVSIFNALGKAISCASDNFAAHQLKLFGHTLFKVPHFSLLLSGFSLLILSLVLRFVIGFYLVDVSFKLGFAILVMPIAIGLWPFPPTKQYLGRIIKLMFHCTGIFIFLCLGATYATALFSAAIGHQMTEIYQYFYEGNTEEVIKNFDVTSNNFFLILFAGVYGFVLIGKMVNDYTSKFFSDGATGLKGQNPMHDRLTQATDFAKQKLGKTAGYIGDVAKTQGLRRIMGGRPGLISKGLSDAGAWLSSKGGKNNFMGRATRHVGGAMKSVGDIGQKMNVNHISQKLAQAGSNLSNKGGIAERIAGNTMQTIGNFGQRMAQNHEAKYQNQDRDSKVKDGYVVPKTGKNP